MGSQRGMRRVGAASATASAAAFMILSAPPASAQPSAQTGSQTASDCKLGPLLCGVLDILHPKPKPPASPATPPKPKPKPPSKPAPHRARHAAPKPAPGPVSQRQPVTPPSAGGPAAPTMPQPVLPQIGAEYPVVLPERPAGSSSAVLMAAADPAGTAPPAVLVAVASGAVGAVGALNVSMLGRRLRRRS